MPSSPSSAISRDELHGEAALAVELLGDRRDALPGERADGVAEQLLLGAEVEIHEPGGMYPGRAAGL